jgi:hypothetical protein
LGKQLNVLGIHREEWLALVVSAEDTFTARGILEKVIRLEGCKVSREDIWFH